MVEQELDVRGLPRPDKHPAIYAAFEHLPVGAAFVLVNNHDLKHLREEFEADYAGGYDWRYVQAGPRVWRIRIARLAGTALPQLLENTLNDPVEPTSTVAVWRLQTRRRDLDANIIDLAPGALVWLPRRSPRRFSAGADGLRYLTVHQRRRALVRAAPARQAVS